MTIALNCDRIHLSEGAERKANRMYRTTWIIIDKRDDGDLKTELTWYHFGKTPKFPTWYMEENHVYEIEMIWNFHLIIRPSIFFKCLTHQYIIK